MSQEDGQQEGNQKTVGKFLPLIVLKITVQNYIEGIASPHVSHVGPS